MNISDKWKKQAELLYRWVRLSQSGTSIEELLLSRNLKKVALYGYSNIARCLLYELSECDVEISYIVDKRSDAISLSFPVISPDQFLTCEKVDALLITLSDVDEVKKVREDLSGKTECKLIDMDELLYEI